MTEETMSGGDAGVTIVVGDETEGRFVDNEELLPEDDASKVIAYFFQRYDNIGIPDEDDLARMWEEAPVRTEHFPATVNDTDSNVEPCPIDRGSGDDGHKTSQAPVDKEAEVAFGAEVVRADTSGNNTSRSVDSGALSAATGPVGDKATASGGDGRTRVDGGQARSEHDQVSAHDSDAVAVETGVKDDSGKVVGSDKQEQPDVTDRDSPYNETTSEHVDGYLEASGDIPKRQEGLESADRKEHQEAERDTTNGYKEEQTSETQGHQKTKPDMSERHEEPESIEAGGHQETECCESEEHQESGPNATEGKQEADSGQTEGHQEAEPNDTEGHQEAEPNETEGHQEAEPNETEGHQEAEPNETEGHQEAEPNETEGHQEAEPNETEGHQEAETAGSEGRHESEPRETNTEVADEQKVESE